VPKININRLDHYYEQAGEGPPLVFIHGAFSDARLWEPQWQYFSSQYQVLRYDLRGHGRTGLSQLAHYTISTLADDLTALLEAREIKSPILCGLSMGGVIAQAYAVRNPDQPGALILAGASVSASLTLSEKLLRYVFMPKWVALSVIRILGVKRFTRFSLRMARYLWGKHWLGLQPENQEYVERCMIQMDGGEFLKIWEAIYSFDLLPLERITCPTLVLNGEFESKGALRHTAEILHRIPQAEAKIIPAASHAMNLESPDVFNRFVETFLLTKYAFFP
jgi:pimeloyl-ACP methyl ester carboxylesterase